MRPTSSDAHEPKMETGAFNALLQRALPWALEQGITAQHMDHGKATLRLPYQVDSVRPGGTIAGPHMMMLADTCMYAVLLSMIGPVELSVTTSFNINFLRKPKECDLLAEGGIIKLGKRLAVMEVDIITDAKGERVAHATGTYSIPPSVLLPG